MALVNLIEELQRLHKRREAFCGGQQQATVEIKPKGGTVNRWLPVGVEGNIIAFGPRPRYLTPIGLDDLDVHRVTNTVMMMMMFRK